MAGVGVGWGRNSRPESGAVALSRLYPLPCATESAIQKSRLLVRGGFESVGKLISEVSIPRSSPLLSERVCEGASPGFLLCFPTPTGFGLGGV